MENSVLTCHFYLSSKIYSAADRLTICPFIKKVYKVALVIFAGLLFPVSSFFLLVDALWTRSWYMPPREKLSEEDLTKKTLHDCLTKKRPKYLWLD